MGLRDVIGRFLKSNETSSSTRATHNPGPLAHEVEQRQDELERKLKERQRRVEVVRAQVRSLGGT